MTTPEPRVRVRGNWMECDHCGIEYGYYSRMEAATQAHRHAATCPALRLAALIRELEELRDNLSRNRARILKQRDWFLAIGDTNLSSYCEGREFSYKVAIDRLTALIDRATDGGTGC